MMLVSMLCFAIWLFRGTLKIIPRRTCLGTLYGPTSYVQSAASLRSTPLFVNNLVIWGGVVSVIIIIITIINLI